MELLSDEGFRFDGRRPHEFRKISGRLGVFDHADGSAILQQVQNLLKFKKFVSAGRLVTFKLYICTIYVHCTYMF